MQGDHQLEPSPYSMDLADLLKMLKELVLWRRKSETYCTHCCPFIDDTLGVGAALTFYWGSLKANHIKASQPHFPHFSAFSCSHFPHFPRFPGFCSVGCLQTLVFVGREGPSAFSAFSPYRVRIADFENPTDRLYCDRL